VTHPTGDRPGRWRFVPGGPPPSRGGGPRRRPSPRCGPLLRRRLPDGDQRAIWRHKEVIKHLDRAAKVVHHLALSAEPSQAAHHRRCAVLIHPFPVLSPQGHDVALAARQAAVSAGSSRATAMSGDVEQPVARVAGDLRVGQRRVAWFRWDVCPVRVRRLAPRQPRAVVVRPDRCASPALGAGSTTSCDTVALPHQDPSWHANLHAWPIRAGAETPAPPGARARSGSMPTPRPVRR